MMNNSSFRRVEFMTTRYVSDLRKHLINVRKHTAIIHHSSFIIHHY